MASESDGRLPAADAAPPGRLAGLGEVAAILLVFAAAGAWPLPDVNETVYLTKALHHADPAYGRGDWFLETPDAHSVFSMLMGPILAACGLEWGAWVGRWLGWLALAVGFRHAVVPLLPTAFGRLLAAALFSLALRHTTAAGEWVIGGCEAKVFAWAGVFAGVGAIGRGRFPTAVLLLGAATALHPIVGGWGLVAGGLTWWRCRREPRSPAGGARRHAGDGPVATEAWSTTAAAVRGGLVAAGLALAAWGVLPAVSLSAGVDAAGRALAGRVYVVERLYHHLLPWTFPEAMIARHLLAILVGTIMHRVVPASPARARVAAFREAALALSLVGLLIAVFEPLTPDVAIGLLRYYWFRLADVIVPFTLAASGAAVLTDDGTCGRILPGRPAVVRGLVVAALVLDLGLQSRHWPLPGRAGLRPRADSKVDAVAWAEICDWAKDHVPPGSRFLTPRGAASFTWRTGLPEVVAWKNSPQDAVSLLEWRRRILDCFSADGTLVEMERSTAALGVERMRDVADRYGADHAIVPLDVAGVEALPFPRLHANRVYAIYRLAPPPESP